MFFVKKKSYDETIAELEKRKAKTQDLLAKEQKIRILKTEIRQANASRHPISKALVEGVTKRIKNIGKGSSNPINSAELKRKLKKNKDAMDMLMKM